MGAKVATFEQCYNAEKRRRLHFNGTWKKGNKVIYIGFAPFSRQYFRQLSVSNLVHPKIGKIYIRKAGESLENEQVAHLLQALA